MSFFKFSFTIVFFLFTTKIFAACSAFVGDATINEFYKESGNNGDAFVEFKLLNSDISYSVYKQWKLKFCYLSGNGKHASNQCETISVSTMNDDSNWIWKYVDRDILNFKDGFDVALLDQNDAFIDYIQVKNYDQQNFSSNCGYNNLDYVFNVPTSATNGTVILLRSPDGTGNWFEDKNTNTYQESPGSNNGGSVNHYEIIHDGFGSTCALEQVTIRACSNADCSSLYSSATSLDFVIGGETKNSATFTGSTSFSFPHTIAENAAITIENENTLSSSPLVCSGSNCSINYSDAGCANSCFAYFPDSAVGHDNSAYIHFKNFTRVINDNDSLLFFPTQIDEILGGSTCNSQDCLVSGTKVSAFTLPSFVTTNVSDDISLTSSSTIATIGPSGDYPITEIDDLNIKDATVTFNSTSSDYIIDNALFEGNAKITFNSGVYWFNDLEFLGNTEVYITGPVTFYVKGQSKNLNIIGNVKINLKGDAQNLAIVSWNSAYFSGNPEIKSAFYGAGNETIFESSVKFTGAMSVFGKLELKDSSTLTAEDVSGVVVGGICGESLVSLDHFEIVHDGNGLTCEAENITIKACSNANCSVPYADAVDVNLVVKNSSNNVIVNESVTVVGGSLDTSFSFTLADTATLSLDQTFECDLNGVDNCNIIFADAGFRFYAEALDNQSDIPTQLAGKPSNIGFNGRVLKLQAVEKDTSNGACKASFIDNVDIEIAASCQNPSNCTDLIDSNNVSLNGAVINTLSKNDALEYSTISLDFGADTEDSAELVFSYPEYGQLQLHARFNILDENHQPTGTYMTGSSNNFVVRPLGFHIDIAPDGDGVSTNPQAINANGDKFTKAGEEFSVTLTAKQWQDGDDVNDDGIADSNALLADNNNTSKFDTAPSDVVKTIISPTLVAPLSGLVGSLAGDTFDDFDSGVQNQNMSYSEVGIISMQALYQHTEYVDAFTITGAVDYVGRFIPDRFELADDPSNPSEKLIVDGDLYVSSTMKDFAYVGQKDGENGAIGYSLAPKFSFYALNVQGEVTQNYAINNDIDSAEDFMKLLSSDISFTDITEDASQLGKDGENNVLINATVSGTLTGDGGTQGLLTFEMDSSNHFTYLHQANSEVSAFTADIDIIVTSVSDIEGVTLADTNDDTVPTPGILKLDPEGIEIRFGRAVLADTYGPETSILPQLLSLEYLDSSGDYVLSADDDFTTFNSDNFSLDYNGHTLTIDDIDATDIDKVDGLFNEVDDAQDGQTKAIVLPAPNKQGLVGVIYDIADWLKYDWDNDEAFDDNPSALASFGIFRGNDRIIYYREVIN